jgi:hypothetical protein
MNDAMNDAVNGAKSPKLAAVILKLSQLTPASALYQQFAFSGQFRRPVVTDCVQLFSMSSIDRSSGGFKVHQHSLRDRQFSANLQRAAKANPKAEA